MPPSTVSSLESETIRRITWRLLPFLIAAYLVNYIDRVNVGFAALQMNKAVGIDPKTYGLGAGIFFLGYFLLEVPSNLIMARVGVKDGRKTAVPFGPFLALGGVVAIFAGPSIVHWYLHTFA